MTQYIERAVPGGDADVPRQGTHAPALESKTHPESSARKQVLVVEPDIAIGKAHQRALQRAGFETVLAQSPFEAGVLVHQLCPAVMTVDLDMPGLHGAEVIDFIRSREHLRNVGVVVLCTRFQKDMWEAVTLCADDAIVKPFTNEVLVETARRLAAIHVEPPE